MRNNILGLLLLTLLITLGGCKDLFTAHNKDFGGVGHGKKIDYSRDGPIRGAKNCTSCHGITLDGNAFIPGCYDCHDALWSKEEHNRARSGGSRNIAINHKRGVFVAEVKCGSCHGAGLIGGSVPDARDPGTFTRPNCGSECHGDNWTRLQDHTTDHGGAKHGTDLWSVDNVGGTTCNDGECHTPTLVGQVEGPIAAIPPATTTSPSCMSCHGPRWLAPAHNISLGGKKHKAGYFSAQNTPASDCGTCHGNTTGPLTLGSVTGANSGVHVVAGCESCHSTLWIKNAHTDEEDGRMHGDGKDYPYTYCTVCHGTNLLGSVVDFGAGVRPVEAPSCYQCHGVEW